MARPNSLLTRVRLRLVKALEPYPDPGEGWCVNCAMNGGRTRVISGAAMDVHLNEHHDWDGPAHQVDVKTREPLARPPR